MMFEAGHWRDGAFVGTCDPFMRRNRDIVVERRCNEHRITDGWRHKIRVHELENH